ncbi:MAG: hypothetical protein L0206_13595 [Actinobacteria bacterium]|nr:hypothetical protein [Actinomycetota bacterium]
MGGGWNYDNRTVLDEDLPPYIQTTAFALLALRGADAPLESRAMCSSVSGAPSRLAG